MNRGVIEAIILFSHRIYNSARTIWPSNSNVTANYLGSSAFLWLQYIRLAIYIVIYISGYISAAIFAAMYLCLVNFGTCACCHDATRKWSFSSRPTLARLARASSVSLKISVGHVYAMSGRLLKCNDFNVTWSRKACDRNVSRRVMETSLCKVN